MNFRFGRILAGVFVFQWIWLGGNTFSAPALEKAIHLRNERILPSVARVEALSAPLRDLILVQFTGSPTRESTEVLRAQGVELLRYVPDDAFIARANGTRPDELRRLPFVRWVGRYRPEHKLHASLQGGGKPVAAADQASDVAILLAPGATEEQRGEIRRLLSEVRHESSTRVGNVLRGKLNAGLRRRVAESPAVLWVEPAKPMRLLDEDASRIVGGDGSDHQTYTQEWGFNGDGVRVAVADSGLHVGTTNGMHPDLAGRVRRFIAYPPLTNAADEHAHGTHVAGIIAGAGVLPQEDANGRRFGLGVAPGAELIIQRIFDSSGMDVAPAWEQLTGDAIEAGAAIGSNSWGDDAEGRYDLTAMEFDERVRDGHLGRAGDQPYCLVFSAGNSGPAVQTISSPAVAKNVIAVGASQSDRKDYFSFIQGREALADFSSRGPCDDGRIKPDVIAPGTWIASLRSPLGLDLNAWQTIDADYLFMGGTSQAAPHVSGAAAVFMQYYLQTYGAGLPSPALTKAALIHSARDSDNRLGTGAAPNMGEGWGRVDLTELIHAARSHLFINESVLLREGEMFETNLVIASSDQPLKITLAYTDFPGVPAAVQALVNDLDLEVLAPDGRVYRGNQFEQGESVPNVPTTDTINNVEGILLRNPVPGEYRVRVKASKIAADAVAATSERDQDFALVICGTIPFPDTGVLLLDRPKYTAPARINLRLFDVDLQGGNSATVTVSSASAPAGLQVRLTPLGESGWYTGSVATTTTAFPGRLLVKDGDGILAAYLDQPEGTTNAATATVDLVPPAIHDVMYVNEFGEAAIEWGTVEPATSLVRYGTTPSTLNRVSGSDLFTLTHHLALTNLIAGQSYYYVVISTDVAGNSTTDDTGLLVPLVAQPPASVLLVDAYTFHPGDRFIDVGAYTNALAEAGVSFAVWDVLERGMMPPAATLRAYQAVIWRINDSQNQPSDTIPPAQQDAIEDYVNQGGAFFMASMEILDRLMAQGGSRFVTNVLHVGRFVQSIPPGSPCPDCDEDHGVPSVLGVPNDVLGAGIDVVLDFSDYPDPFFLGQDQADTFRAATNACPFLVEAASGRACGVRFPQTGEESAGRVVFVSFPLDALPESGVGPDSRAGFLQRVLQFLVPGLRGLGTIALDRSRYGLPDLLTIEVADSDLIGQPSVTVQVSSPRDSPVPAVLLPTPRPGLFRGTLSMVSASGPGEAGQLRAFDGDTIIAEYREPRGDSTFTTNQAVATVDTLPPNFTNLHFSLGFSEVTISWETDEPADSLVLFGESIFLGRTAFSSVFESAHSLTLTGLSPERAYFFKVVSRDAAGNSASADDGAIYIYDTLGPRQAPYPDDLEADDTTNFWRVVNGPQTQSQWEWTSPQSVVAGAHSPSHAWASPRLAVEATTIDTTLISPAFLLENGNVATLRFWHAYDFRKQSQSDNELGQLLVLTNTLSPPVLLAEYRNTNLDWRLEQVDLSAYIGRPIFLVWRHRLDSSVAAFRQGWALDDLLVTVTNLPPGTIQISNNLSQAKLILSGPALRLVEGPAATLGGLPPGLYVANWAPVPFYNTPPPQTNALVSNGLLRFTGTYTFPDLNTNLISDLFETAYFGGVSLARDRFTDTDGDGQTDLAEFAAGTNPTNANSVLRLTVTWAAEAAQLQLRWPAVPGHRYRLEASSNLTLWSPAGDWVATPGTNLSRTVPVIPGLRAFYRLEVQP